MGNGGLVIFHSKLAFRFTLDVVVTMAVASGIILDKEIAVWKVGRGLAMDSGDSGEDEHQCQTTPRGRARRATAGQGTRRSTDATHTKGIARAGRRERAARGGAQRRRAVP